MDALFRNHLAFLRRHRGDFYVSPNAIYIVTEAPGMTSWVPLSEQADPPPDFEAVRLIPQSGSAWCERLARSGFAPAEALSYQDFPLANSLTPRRAVPDLEVRRASSRDDALAFADVQSAGFLSGDSPGDEWWRQFFPRVALRNYEDPDQDFLMIFLDGTAAAGLLLVHEDGVSGIYAVATRPEHRNRGLSSRLLQAAVERTRERGSDQLILQAMAGSFADGFYRRSGFQERYQSQVWRKASEQ